MDKVDNQTIECMVCASCTFKGEKRQEERKIDRSEGEAGGRSQGDVEEEKIELSKNPEGVKILRIVRCRRMRLCGKIPQDGAADIKNDSDIETCMQWPDVR